MNNSPDSFYSVRYHCASLKSQQPFLQSMEFRAHNNTVNEYCDEMLQHLLNIQCKTHPNLSLIQQQPEINLKMRPLLLDFLMDVINKLNLSKSTFPLCVNLIDRYCSTRIVKKQHYQLLGLTSLWISCKNSDSKIKIPNLNDLCKMCCNCYDKKLFLEMENHLLKSLNWMISFPTFDSFIDIICKEYSTYQIFNGSNFTLKQVKYLSIYICELIQFYPNIYFNYNSCEISSSSFLISLLILNFKINYSVEILKLNKLAGSKELINLKNFISLFNSLIKVLKCPPPSLKLKYFNKSNKNLNLMQLLIKFCNINLTPVSSNPITPKNSIHKLNHFPPTPLSSNISPTNNAHNHIHNTHNHNNDSYKDFLPSPRLSPHNSTTTYFQSSPPFTPLDVKSLNDSMNIPVLAPGSNYQATTTTTTATSTNAAYNPACGVNLAATTHNITENDTMNNKNISSSSSLVIESEEKLTNSPSFSPPSVVSNNSSFLSTSAVSMKTSISAPILNKKRSYQILSIDQDSIAIDENDNLKRSKSQKPVFFIS
ncbi:G1/S-specific cyclin Cln3p [[Candida] anglica]|uniref:G1/S-specific cyclin Cln3p n=1 Tax=[Candida] anglica TaxID=148631 RepID=A0ABP0ELG3_9ASCO